MTLFAYLDSTPSLDEMTQVLTHLGFCYRHTLPADERWNYPMHVFGANDFDVRVVYHAGDCGCGEAVVDTTTRGNSPNDLARLRIVLNILVSRYGGAISDPQQLRRGMF